MNRRHLLTGAGFTHNFGAPLADQMWALILSHVSGKETPGLRARLLDNFDFEDVYYQVMEKERNEVDQAAFTAAIRRSYQMVDEIVTQFKWVAGARHAVCLPMVQKLIGAFAPKSSERAFLFTLNQDLFLERHYYNGPRPFVPGIVERSEWFSSHFRQPLSQALNCSLPSAEQLERQKTTAIRDGLYYIKLHGSCNWLGAGGKDRMVLGRGKSAQIEQEPLLSWYLNLFRDALLAGGVRLFVIGYGFKDPHINAVIAEAIVNADLELFVLSPEPPSTFKEKIQLAERGVEIWNGVVAYFQTTLAELFPSNQDTTPEWRFIQSRFFDVRII